MRTKTQLVASTADLFRLFGKKRAMRIIRKQHALARELSRAPGMIIVKRTSIRDTDKPNWLVIADVEGKNEAHFEFLGRWVGPQYQH